MSVSKTISEAILYLAQTMHVSYTISKRIERDSI
jgi:hypothetical protein